MVFLSSSFMEETGVPLGRLPLKVSEAELLRVINPFAHASSFFGTPERSTFLDEAMSASAPAETSFQDVDVVTTLRFCAYVYRHLEHRKKSPNFRNVEETFKHSDTDDTAIGKARQWYRGQRSNDAGPGDPYRGEIMAPAYRAKELGDSGGSKVVLTMRSTSEVRY